MVNVFALGTCRNKENYVFFPSLFIKVIYGNWHVLKLAFDGFLKRVFLMRPPSFKHDSFPYDTQVTEYKPSIACFIIE